MNKYCLFYELISPVQIGYLPNESENVVARARRYVPGINIWGAVTCNIAENISPNDNNYKIAGEWLEKNFIFSYFYIAEFDGNNLKMLAPDYDRNDGLKFGNVPATEFDHLYIGSGMSTAKNEAGTAKDKTLHENEYILPLNRDGKRTMIAGIVMANTADPGPLGMRYGENAVTINNLDILDNVTAGGNQNYGLGKLKRTYLNKSAENDLINFYDNIAQDEIKPGVEILLRTHLEYCDNIRYRGAIEIISGRSTKHRDKKGHELAITPKYFFAPGTYIELNENARNHNLKMTAMGRIERAV